MYTRESHGALHPAVMIPTKTFWQRLLHTPNDDDDDSCHIYFDSPFDMVLLKVIKTRRFSTYRLLSIHQLTFPTFLSLDDKKLWYWYCRIYEPSPTIATNGSVTMNSTFRGAIHRASINKRWRQLLIYDGNVRTVFPPIISSSVNFQEQYKDTTDLTFPTITYLPLFFDIPCR